MTSRSPLAPFLVLLLPIGTTPRQKHHPDISVAKVDDSRALLLGRGQHTPSLELVPVAVGTTSLAGLPIKGASQLFHIANSLQNPH